MRLLFLSFFLPTFSIAASLNLNDMSDRSFKNEDYKLSFKIEQSLHGTKNTLTVNFQCKNKKGEIVKKSIQHEVCNIDYKSVKINKEKRGYLIEYAPHMQADWAQFNQAMRKGKDIKPKCLRRSKERFKLEALKCK